MVSSATCRSSYPTYGIGIEKISMVPRNILQLNIPVPFPGLYRSTVLIPRTFPSFELKNGTRCGIVRAAECFKLRKVLGAGTHVALACESCELRDPRKKKG